MKVNIQQSGGHVCAFCRYWYDPTNSAIKPIAPKNGFWEFDDRARNLCTKTGFNKPGGARCDNYEPKV